MTTAASFDAIVLAGGRGSRLGGVDKAALELGGERLVARTVTAVRAAGAERVVVVGPRSSAVPGSVTVREDPPFSGPLAALAAGLDALMGASNKNTDALMGASNRNTDAGNTEALQSTAAGWVMLLACDLIDPAAVCQALTMKHSKHPEHDGAVLTDPEGRTQWLASLVRADKLREGLEALRAEPTGTDTHSGADPEPDPFAHRPVRLAFSRVRLTEIPAPHTATADIDTPEDLEQAFRRAQDAE